MNMGTGDLVYEVECMYCRRKFRVPDISSPVPKHPAEGEIRIPGRPYIPCVGSNLKGVPVKPLIEGFE